MVEQAKRVPRLMCNRIGQRSRTVHRTSFAILHSSLGPSYQVEGEYDVRLVILERADRADSRGVQV